MVSKFDELLLLEWPFLFKFAESLPAHHKFVNTSDTGMNLHLFSIISEPPITHNYTKHKTKANIMKLSIVSIAYVAAIAQSSAFTVSMNEPSKARSSKTQIRASYFMEEISPVQINETAVSKPIQAKKAIKQKSGGVHQKGIFSPIFMTAKKVKVIFQLLLLETDPKQSQRKGHRHALRGDFIFPQYA